MFKADRRTERWFAKANKAVLKAEKLASKGRWTAALSVLDAILHRIRKTLGEGAAPAFYPLLARAAILRESGHPSFAAPLVEAFRSANHAEDVALDWSCSAQRALARRCEDWGVLPELAAAIREGLFAEWLAYLKHTLEAAQARDREGDPEAAAERLVFGLGAAAVMGPMPPDPLLGRYLFKLGMIRGELGRLDEAEEALRESMNTLSAYRRTCAPGETDTRRPDASLLEVRVLRGLGILLLERNDGAGAAALLEEALGELQLRDDPGRSLVQPSLELCLAAFQLDLDPARSAGLRHSATRRLEARPASADLADGLSALYLELLQDGFGSRLMNAKWAGRVLTCAGDHAEELIARGGVASAGRLADAILTLTQELGSGAGHDALRYALWQWIWRLWAEKRYSEMASPLESVVALADRERESPTRGEGDRFDERDTTLVTVWQVFSQSGIEGDACHALRLLAHVHELTGHPSDRLEVAKRLVERVRVSVGSTSSLLVAALAILADAHRRLGEIAASAECERRLQSLLRASTDARARQHLFDSISRSNHDSNRLGDRQGLLEDAEEWASLGREAVATAGASAIPFWMRFQAARKMAFDLAQKGETARARSLLAGLRPEGAEVALAAPEWGPMICLAEAQIVASAGKAEEALLLADRGIEATGGLPTGVVGSLRCDLHLLRGRILLDLSRPEEAEHAVREAVSADSSSPFGREPSESDPRETLISMLLEDGRYRDALEQLLEREQRRDEALAQLFSGAPRKVVLGFLRGRISKGLGDVLSLVAQHFSTDHDAVARAFALALRRKGVMLDVEKGQRALMRAPSGVELADLQARIDELSQQIQTSVNRPAETTDVDQVRQVRAERERLEVDLAGLSMRGTGAPPGMRAMGAEEVARALPENSVLLDFVLAERSSLPGLVDCFAFVLAARQASSLAIVRLASDPEGPLSGAWLPDRLAQAVSRFLAQVKDVGRESGDHPERALGPTAPGLAGGSAAVELHDMLMAPLWPFVGDADHLVLSPDGLLTQISFASLPLPSGGSIIDRYQISYLGVARDLLEAPPEPTHRDRQALVIADPDFDLAADSSPAQDAPAAGSGVPLSTAVRGPRFPRLAGTRREGVGVHAIVGGRVLMEAAATEAAVRSHHSPPVLHIASHGFFVPQKPGGELERFLSAGDWAAWALESTGEVREEEEASVPDGGESALGGAGIVLAGVNSWLGGRSRPEAAEDGVLTAMDIAGLNLEGTEMVVLSACETGRADSECVGSGVFGLRRAFRLAGARSIVMSLWKVPDEETCDLMLSFYQHLMSGAPKSVALRRAQLELKARRPEPFYWAAFICEGHAGPLPWI